MNTYNIFVKSNNNPRTINTPMMGRTYYTKVVVTGNRADLVAKVNELKAEGNVINEICLPLGTRIYL